MILFLVPALPLLAAIVAAFPRSDRYLALVTFIAALCATTTSFAIAMGVAQRGTLTALPHWVALDALSAVLLCVITAVTTLAALFSWGYISSTANATVFPPRIYYANFNLFVVSMLLIPLMLEPGLAWIAVELTTLLSIFLVAFENTRGALEAAWKYMTITLLGATMAVLGFLVLFWAMKAAHADDFTWSGLRAQASAMPAPLLEVGFLLILVGFGAKVGLVPLHTWLPDAHSQAPSPVCALLSGIETTVVLYVILRLLPIVRATPLVHASLWAIIFGLISTGVAAFLIMQTHDYKRLFAFSTVEHMGFILTAAAIGGSLAAYGTIWQIVNHAFTKSFCFYAAGAVLLLTGSREVSAVRGLIERSRLSGTALLVGALAIAGAPPFAVFSSELVVLRAGFARGEYVTTGMLALFIVIAFFGMLSQVNRMVFGTPSATASPSAVRAYALPLPCTISLVIAAIPVLALGLIMPHPVHELLAQAALGLSR